MLKNIVFLFALSPLVFGCATSGKEQPLAANHPASCCAPTSRIEPPSLTLAIGEEAPATPAGATPAHGERTMQDMQHAQAATSQPTTEQTMYACPMHPEVISANPNDRCPKCGMKINEPLKKSSDAPVPPTPGNGGQNAGHGGHQ